MSDKLNLGYSNLYFGRKWWGKTQQAVIDAYEAYKDGAVIISNIWLGFPHIRFWDSSSLVPILKEIWAYANDHIMAIEAPKEMLKEYGMKRKTGTVKRFFLLFDEIGNHLNNRNWQKNFKDPMLRDMLTEPRKYKLTIVGVCQSYEDVDVAFLRSCEDWFLFSKAGGWIFRHYKCTHFWVINGKLEITEQWILDRRKKFEFFWKVLTMYRSLYWTGEIVWSWVKSERPHQFTAGMIYVPTPISSFSAYEQAIKNDQSDSGGNMGGTGGTPPGTFTTKKIKTWRKVSGK